MTVIGPTNLDPSDLGPIPVDSPDVLSTEPDRADDVFRRLVVNEALYSSIPSHLYSDPRITNIDPASANAGETVTVWGYALQGATAVMFGAVPATNIVPESNRDVKCDVPAGTGTVQVTVTTPQGTSAGHPFTYATRSTGESDGGESALAAQGNPTATTPRRRTRNGGKKVAPESPEVVDVYHDDDADDEGSDEPE
jgi:hypothetical protein